MSQDNEPADKDAREWSCKVGPFPEDFPQQKEWEFKLAVKAVYINIFGKAPGFFSSGFDGMRKIHRVEATQEAIKDREKLIIIAGDYAIRHPEDAQAIAATFDKAWANGDTPIQQEGKVPA